jgi:hypothetical protein
MQPGFVTDAYHGQPSSNWYEPILCITCNALNHKSTENQRNNHDRTDY